ncbi:MAG: ribosome maturation factor RimM [Pseudohongiellaceae bacterium]
MPAQKPDSRVSLGRIGAPHGIRGWVKLHSFTEPLMNIADFRVFHCAGRRDAPDRMKTLELDEIRAHGKTLIAHVKGYDTPEQARELTGLELEVEAGVLPALEEGEYYWADLQGLRVINRQGERLGRVSHLLETGANDVLVVAADEESIDDQERLIPWLPGQSIDRVRLDERCLDVDWESDW